MSSSVTHFSGFGLHGGLGLKGVMGRYDNCNGPCWRPHAMRDAALGLAQGDPSPLALALDEVSDRPERQVCVCEHVISAFSELWAEDLCNEGQISLGLALALSTFRHHQADIDAPAQGDPLLIVPVPGEPHFIGASLAYTMLCQAGRTVAYEFPRSDRELADLLGSRPFSGLVLITSGVFPRLHRTERIHHTVEQARRHALRPLRVVLYGKLAGCADSAAHSVGADGACCSALQIHRLFDHSAHRIH